MTIKKLTSTDAFVVFDLDGAPSSMGFVRCAPKLLASSSQELARSSTYMLAVHGFARGGASAGINAQGDDCPQCVQAFVAEVGALVADGTFLPDAGKGIAEEALAGLRGADSRPGILFEEFEGMTFQQYLRGAGAASAVAAASAGTSADLAGLSVCIEGFDAVGLACAIELAQQGAKLVAVSTPAGCVANPAGFATETLRDSFQSHGDNLVAQLAAQLGAEPQPAEQIFSVDCDIFMAGSNFGIVDHNTAELMQPKVLGSLQHLAFTTRGLLTLERKDAKVLPGFLSLGGALYAEKLLADAANSQLSHREIIAFAQSEIAALTSELAAHPEGVFLAACYRAEEFILTWRDELPFGRPLAP